MTPKFAYGQMVKIKVREGHPASGQTGKIVGLWPDQDGVYAYLVTAEIPEPTPEEKEMGIEIPVWARNRMDLRENEMEAA